MICLIRETKLLVAPLSMIIESVPLTCKSSLAILELEEENSSLSSLRHGSGMFSRNIVGQLYLLLYSF